MLCLSSLAGCASDYAGGEAGGWYQSEKETAGFMLLMAPIAIPVAIALSPVTVPYMLLKDNDIQKPSPKIEKSIVTTRFLNLQSSQYSYPTVSFQNGEYKAWIPVYPTDLDSPEKSQKLKIASQKTFEALIGATVKPLGLNYDWTAYEVGNQWFVLNRECHVIGQVKDNQYEKFGAIGNGDNNEIQNIEQLCATF